MTRKQHLLRLMAMLLCVAVVLSLAPAVFAASHKQTVTEYFVDSYGEKIAIPTTSTAEAKNAPDVSGYIYSKQSTKTTYVYAEEHIQYIIGYPDGSVKVDQNMCRSEAVAVLYRLYNGNYPAFTKRMSNNTFADVTSKAWFYKELETLYNVGIIDDEEYFRPDDPITRAEFAIMCAKYDGLVYLDKAKFSDVKPGHWAYSYINAAAEKGWINGYPDGTFRPDNYITRAEVMSLVNRLFNRPVTKDRLPANVNPYNDITESHWAYCDAMEATVKHDAVNWHGVQYNGGVYNIVIERFVDTSGKEISKPVTTQDKPNYHPAALNGYNYLGYITEVTYVYTNGATAPGIEKTASVSTSAVGDTVKYTITLTNGKDATDAWRDVFVTDEIPEHLSFVHGSVYIGSKSAEYSFADDLLSVPVGNIEIDKSVKVTFETLVLSTAYGETITNEATGTGSNGGPVKAEDDGVAVADGTAYMGATKSVDKPTAKLGDTLTYTVKVTNSEAATVNLENVVMSDVISEYLSFAHGSVQVDSYSAKYSYDNESRQLSVELGDIAPDQTKTITFSALINSTAYGKSFTNTAVLSADNDGDKTATDGGVTVDNGTAEGSVGAKTVSSPTAKVGDTLTYTITLRNASTATAAWTGVEVSDVIPEYLSFVSGSVEEDERASANYSYNAGTKTLTLFADSIDIGETMTFTFKVTVEDGAQGMYIVNTALVSSDDREDIQLPDTGVQIDDGDTVPYMSKTASVSEARAGDIFTYTVTIKNGMDATAAWKDVILSDVLPSGVKLVSGSVTLNGQTVSYGVAGQAIEVTVGDLKAGAEAIVTFDVRVLDSAEGTTIHNVAVAKGDNGEKTATDNGVTVPEPELPNDDSTSVTGSKTVDKTLVNTGDSRTFPHSDAG